MGQRSHRAAIHSVIAAVAFITMLNCPAAHGSTIYVSATNGNDDQIAIYVSATSGNDSQNGASEAKAFQSLNAALSFASQAPGDYDILVESGVYTSTSDNVLSSGTTLSASYGFVAGLSAQSITLVYFGGANLVLSAGSALDMDLGSASSSVALSFGTGGALTLDSPTLEVTPGAGFGPGVYTVFSGITSFNGAGFESVTGLDPSQYSTSLSFNGNQYQLTVTTVPEPQGLLLVMAAASLSGRRRINREKGQLKMTGP